jgi:hypothetical protein
MRRPQLTTDDHQASPPAAPRGARALGRAAGRLDPGGRDLRLAALTMTATLASYATALALEHAEHLGLSVVVLAVVLSLSLSRHEHGRGVRDRAIGGVALPLVAVAASEVGSLLERHADLGDALFVVAVSGAIWLRRFGPACARLGTVVTLPFIALLVAPAVPGGGHAHLLWAAAVGAIAYLWVSVVQTVGERTGFAGAASRPAVRPAAPVRAPRRRGAPVASTRMAIQMAAALAAAFALGRGLFGVHWSWVVITAFIVSSGNRGRGDVVYKSVLRLAGAAAGTVAATLVSGVMPPADAWSVALIFVVLAVAVWLRPRSYAYWAAGVTAVLAVLYRYFGEAGSGAVLAQRLEGIALGALIAVAAAWLIMPVRTTDVLRRRTADALAALAAAVAAIGGPHDELAARAGRFDHTVSLLDEIAPALHAHRRLSARRSGAPHGADAVDAARRARSAMLAIVESSARDPTALTAPAAAWRTRLIAARIRTTRQAMASRAPSAPPPHPVAAGEPAPGSPPTPVELTLAELDAAIASFHHQRPANSA